MKGIKSETKVLFDLALGILKSPFIFILALFGKESFEKVFSPFSVLFRSFFEPKYTLFLCFSLVIFFVLSLFFNEFAIIFLLYPSDFFSERFFSLITHGFLHGDISHLLSNILVIYIFGRIVEKEFGRNKLLLIYFFGLIFAGLFSSIVNLYQGISIASLGASGAAMALVSAATFFRPLNFSFIFLIPLPVFFIGWSFFLSDILGIIELSSNNIGYFAHVGGFISSFLLFIFLKEYKEVLRGLLINLVVLVCFLFFYY